MSGRAYTVVIDATSVTGAVDLFEITPADDKPVEIVGIEFGQSSDAGDAQDELLKFSIIRGHTTSGSGGATLTPVPMNPNDAAAGFTAETQNSTVASSGTTTTLLASCWNVRAGYIQWFPEGMRPTVTQANTTLVIRQLAPADAITMSATLYLRELA